MLLFLCSATCEERVNISPFASIENHSAFVGFCYGELLSCHLNALFMVRQICCCCCCIQHFSFFTLFGFIFPSFFDWVLFVSYLVLFFWFYYAEAIKNPIHVCFLEIVQKTREKLNNGKQKLSRSLALYGFDRNMCQLVFTISNNMYECIARGRFFPI